MLISIVENLKQSKLVSGIFDINMPLEELLIELEKYGKPRLGKYNQGWHCHIEIHVSNINKGTQIEVKSDFDHDTPTIATAECLKRLVKTIEELKKIGT